MKIRSAEAKYYRWPRPSPVSNGRHTWTDMQMGVVTITTDDGLTGIGIGSASPGERQFREEFCARIIGMDATLTERIWAILSDSKMYGRRGFETAALAPIDMALWDIKAKRANLPLHRLIGGYRDSVPVYIAGGYYGADKTLRDLQAEMAGYVEKGARAVKMKVGRVSQAEDAARVEAVRAAIGPDITLMIDANCAYRSYEAIQFARRVEEFDIAWFEEPVGPEDYAGFSRIGMQTSIPIAAGEQEYRVHGFRDLIATGAIGIIQPDARWMGGVTEFMKVAALAQAQGIAIAAHGPQHIHLPLIGAIPNGIYAEYYHGDFDTPHGPIFLDEPSIDDNGSVSLSQSPGTGFALKPDVIAKLSV
ncbi:mandelate racemase/muconate lactonizing enzyme family protein [Mesorhizobium sp.]|uniref:mandelate racemase/muconate lactonizing enzyme family protein n=1 Tax=Mesorhizobium sp. TaxID=1871066 RepID=UPI000FEA15A8|nr:mandelate racemase/muconate lactonizing enzyme family protein [Mesorhizobium sp.]RWD98776.1 MAG: mandelate racemase/muconate lactonizing enzyme family protein [Mesorhizobium sp.]